MNYKNSIILLLLILSCTLSAQVKAPKWADKAKRAVVHITTYDKEGKTLGEGTAFFIDENGTALSDFSLFKGVNSAKATDYEGKEMPVELIMGINDLYNVAKIRITPPEKKKVPFLKIASVKPQIGEEVALLAFSPEKELHVTLGSLEQIAPLGGDSYYTLSMVMGDDQTSAPVLTEKGEVFGLAQKAVSSSGKAYAMAASFANNLSIAPLSFNDNLLNGIGIAKDLPATQEQALAMLYIASSTVDKDRYYDLLNRFIQRYPNASEGYQLRSAYYTTLFDDIPHLELAEKDMKLAMEHAEDKDYAYYHNSQCILNYVARHDSTTSPYKDWTYQKSLDEVQKAIAINPQPIYYQHLANIYSLMKNYEKAYEMYEKVNRTNLASPSTFYAASRLKRIMNDTTGIALALMDSCISRFNTPYTTEAAPYLFERAEMRTFAGRDAEALQDYDAYEKCAPSPPNAVFYYRREQAAMRAGMIDRALQDIQKALTLSPNDASLLEEAGSIYVTIFRYDDALKKLDAALAKEPNRPYAWRLKGYALLKQDKKEEARKALLRGKELGDDISIQLLGRFYKE